MKEKVTISSFPNSVGERRKTLFRAHSSVIRPDGEIKKWKFQSISSLAQGKIGAKFSIMKLLPMAVALTLAAASLAAADDGVNSAYQTAKSAVGGASQDKVVSVYGIGSPTVIHTWYVIFYNPSVASHGRVVVVKDGAVTKTHDATVGSAYSGKLAFDPARITSEGPALSAAQTYAAKHHIAYDGVRALLKETSVNKPFRWRIQLMDAGASKGYIYINAVNDTVAYYRAPVGREGGHGDSASQDAQDFGNDVQKTFLGIGGDLQQFFTGERTVDQ